MKKYDGYCIILGNESRGSSLDDFSVIPITIPIQNIESLNVSAAAAILINYFSYLSK
jgi:tRNA G18 (ribose-2'-O)-methylase SpoU